MIRAGKLRSVMKLDALRSTLTYLPLDTATMRRTDSSTLVPGRRKTEPSRQIESKAEVETLAEARARRLEAELAEARKLLDSLKSSGTISEREVGDDADAGEDQGAAEDA